MPRKSEEECRSAVAAPLPECDRRTVSAWEERHTARHMILAQLRPFSLLEPVPEHRSTGATCLNTHHAMCRVLLLRVLTGMMHALCACERPIDVRDSMKLQRDMTGSRS